ncbi:MAG: hypothetical protein HY737_00530 [Candidatus Omnitrophica bacterium]|nr:hypothetical protein [Candidatus Omnitrophota bacterium]
MEGHRALKHAFTCFLTVCVITASWPLRLAADDEQHRWAQTLSALKRGEYSQALDAAERAASLHPNDPWAPLYTQLAEQRLQTPAGFAQLTPQQLAALKGRLAEEERQQRRAGSALRAMERQITREQSRWDRALAHEQQQAERVAKQHERQLKREARKQVTAKRAEATPTVPAVIAERAEEPSAPAPAPAEIAALAPAERAPSVELSPVFVGSPLPPPSGDAQATIPSLRGRPTPPSGAVQINARQMHMSPDQKVAVADGDVEVVYEDTLLTADHLTLFTDTKDVYAEGRIRLEQGAQVFRGDAAQYNFVTHKGRFLQGTVSSPPWHQHGRTVEHVAEGVYEVTPGYLTSCDMEPPHFKFSGRRAIVFAEDRLARASSAALFVEQVPVFYLPWMVFSELQSPFYVIPGKKKPWEQFVLTGYRYEWPQNHQGNFHLDWRRNFAWGEGWDHAFESTAFGRGLIKLYYNQVGNRAMRAEERPKGADHDRYRAMLRHQWQPMPDTNVITNFSKFSDANFRQEFLFREEFTKDESPESFISAVQSTDAYALTSLFRRRVNRFDTTTNAEPELTFQVNPKQIGTSQLFSEAALDIANLQTKLPHSDNDTDAIRVDWFQELKYAMSLFRPLEVTPRAGMRQTFYTKDRQGTDRQGQRDFLSGQFSMGADASLKLFRVFPVMSNWAGLNLHWLRHVVTPTLAYEYVAPPTVPDNLLSFSAAEGVTNRMTFGLENKLQTRRPLGPNNKLRNVDLARLLVSVPYTYRGRGNKQGGRLGEFSVDVETYPWPWMRLETAWEIPSHFPKGSRDTRVQTWNMDLVLVGGQGQPTAYAASDVQAPVYRAFEPGVRGGIELLPQGQWYFGMGHRYSQNDKTETVMEFDWGLSPKWQLTTFHRYTWKEVSGSAKRFNNLREYQYSLRRDLHDWMAEFIYRVDREFGEEVLFTLTLKAFPQMPIEAGDSYHQPKIGSQSSPFSPIRIQQ